MAIPTTDWLTCEVLERQAVAFAQQAQAADELQGSLGALRVGEQLLMPGIAKLEECVHSHLHVSSIKAGHQGPDVSPAEFPCKVMTRCQSAGNTPTCSTRCSPWYL